MKTVREAYGVKEPSIVYPDGRFSPSRMGDVYPDDLEWRFKAAIEYRKNSLKDNATIRGLIVNELCVDDYTSSVKAVIEFDRLYPKQLGKGLMEITEFRSNRLKKSVIKLSKLLMRVAPFSKPHKVRGICDLVLLKDSQCSVEYTREPAKVLSAYARIRSCMSDTNLPLIYLQDSKTQLAIIKAGPQIVGRCWVRGGKRSNLYRFPIFENSCLEAIALAGFEEDANFLEGVNFFAPEGVFPYLDSCLGRVDFENGFITPNPRGEYKTSEEGRLKLIG